MLVYSNLFSRRVLISPTALSGHYVYMTVSAGWGPESGQRERDRHQCQVTEVHLDQISLVPGLGFSLQWPGDYSLDLQKTRKN
ncbi:hypothetical protein RRG08_007395 [Elysia crispata]|uniref:Uncharacterized protein n=1 Tax=Elysia crispata TaxID=231223 RepID=A0AAE1DRN0_9GAST|nr:hypothetical protein RRG08_007395 [Elysia crispata]